MTARPSENVSELRRRSVSAAIAVVVLSALFYYGTRGMRPVDFRAASKSNDTIATSSSADESKHPNDHSHDDNHRHDHSSDAATQSILLSEQALKNLGLTANHIKPVELTTFHRTISIPAIVAPRPGRTHLHVASPLSGLVTHVHAVTGESVHPGHLLFEVRLTHEDLVESQTQFLKTLADIEIETREIGRLEEVTRIGAVSSKVLLERQYAKEKLESLLVSQREALKLHGLNDDQIHRIDAERRLLRDLSIVAPNTDSHSHDGSEHRTAPGFAQVSPNASLDVVTISAREPVLIIEDLKVNKGQGVVAGEMLCTLSDYSHLYIEGKAFEQDGSVLANALANQWTVDASFSTPSGDELVGGLKIEFIDNSIDATSRSLSFYVDLPNTIVSDRTNDSGQRFVSWKYRIGQRLQLRIPIEKWDSQIVLPIDAVVKDGANWYVFQQNGEQFDQTAVHVKYRDQAQVVIENDGSIFPGDVVAMRSAHQLLTAIKNKSLGSVDPHAGHSH